MQKPEKTNMNPIVSIERHTTQPTTQVVRTIEFYRYVGSPVLCLARMAIHAYDPSINFDWQMPGEIRTTPLVKGRLSNVPPGASRACTIDLAAIPTNPPADGQYQRMPQWDCVAMELPADELEAVHRKLGSRN